MFKGARAHLNIEIFLMLSNIEISEIFEIAIQNFKLQFTIQTHGYR